MLLDRTDLPADVREELLDPRFLGRTHGYRRTYLHGCHGPLCKKPEREYMRIRTARKAFRQGKMYTPAIALRTHLMPINRDELLEEIIEQHILERKSRPRKKDAKRKSKVI